MLSRSVLKHHYKDCGNQVTTDKTPTYEKMGFTKAQWKAFTSEQRHNIRVEYNTRVEGGNW
jgi:hypothetical protein